MHETEIALRRVRPEEKSILKHLFQLYLHDFTEFDNADIGEDGLYDYPYLELYWIEPERHPFFVQVNGHWAGFILVWEIAEENEPLRNSIAEFFILRKYRRRGVGRQTAFQIFDQFPGEWLVQQIPENIHAQAFWQRVIHEYTHGNFHLHQGEHGPYQTFTSRKTPITQ